MTKFLPVLVGTDIGAYSIARSFHEAYGIKSLALGKAQMWMTDNSKIIDSIICDNLDGQVLIDKLIEIAKQYEDMSKILFGCGDWYVRTIIENKDQLKDYYIIPYIDENILNEIVLKDKFYNYCRELDIDYPKTFVVDKTIYNDFEIPFDFPIIAKTNNTAMYHYATFPGKKKVFKFDNMTELKEMLNNLYQSSYDDKFLIQDFIPGDDSAMRVLTCYCDKNSNVVFASLGNVLLEENTPGAIGNYAAIINEADKEIIKPIVEQATKFLKRVNYIGFANFDIKYDSRDGKYKFFEINTRLGRSNFYVTGSGFNTVKYIVDEYIENVTFDGIIYADKENLYKIIPMYIINKYVRNKKLKALAKRLKKRGQVTNPMIYKKDLNIKRLFYIYGALLNQIRKYRKYYDK